MAPRPPLQPRCAALARRQQPPCAGQRRCDRMPRPYAGVVAGHSTMGGNRSEREPDVPEVREEAPVERGVQVLDPGRAAGAGRVPISRAAISAWWWRQRATPRRGRAAARPRRAAGAQRVAGVVAVEVGERLEPRLALLGQPRRRSRTPRRATRRPAARPRPAMSRARPRSTRSRGTGATGSRTPARAGRGTRGSPRGPSSRAPRAGSAAAADGHGRGAGAARRRAAGRRAARRGRVVSSCRISLNHSS